ncbi:TOBE domain-containing protein, partial [Candidatus Bipolaricaulota bacterium]|nr:TOBE domain-containing protein [Candidatus Bipolaricaulota bacterium]
EPLSNLDAKLRVQMRTELEELHHKLQTTTIYVTHDQVEAMTLGDRIAVMKDGVIHQYSSPQETYDHPANQFVAGFIGSPAMNFLPATAASDGGRTLLSGSSFRIRLPEARSRADLPTDIVIGIRPEDLSGPVADDVNTISFVVSVREQLGHSLLVYGYLDGTQIVASLDPHARVTLDASIHLQVNVDTLHVFEPESEALLI